MGLHLSGIVAGVSLVPAVFTILLRHRLPLPMTLALGHMSLVGFAVAVATTDQFAAHSTQLLAKVEILVTCMPTLVAKWVQHHFSVS